MLWSLENYCASQQAIDYDGFPSSSRDFLEALNLPSVHPFCSEDAPPFNVDGIPPMGRLDNRFEGESVLEVLITLCFMVAPSLLAMAELWLRLFAGAIGPLGMLYIAGDELQGRGATKKLEKCSRIFPWICAISLASNLVLMSDAMYVLDNGKVYGAALFVASLILSIRVWMRYNLTRLGMFISIVVLLASHLVYDYETKTLSFGDKTKEVLIDEGLYYNDSNTYVKSIVENWPETYRTYQKMDGQATLWMPSGDSRTGLPFLANHVPRQNWKRFFLETVDQEYVALDIAFPQSGHNTSNPVYLVLHGLNGGTDEEYVNDLAMRRTAAGSTVVVMIARGLMDLPIRGWNLFHGARTTDAHSAALALRRVVSQDQIIVGVGYSMGAIILNNYVASYGSDCALDAALAISGGLDMRYQEDFFRARRLWQPMLTETARDEFFLGKWGHRVKARLSESNLLGLMRAKDITELDIAAVAPYSGFDDVHHYYREMSALGDIQHKPDGTMEENYQGKKVDSISIPLVVLQALDDPLVTWRATCANEGLMHPDKLVATGSGNLVLLLTKFGGHVGWPVGLFFFRNNWKWMSDAAMSFAEAVQEAKRIQQEESTEF